MKIINHSDLVSTADDGDLLVVSAPGSEILNYGDLTTSGITASGLVATADGAKLVNFGDVATAGDGSAGMIAGTVLAPVNDARVINHGTITTSGGTYDANGVPDDDDLYADGMDAIGDGERVDNYGVISTLDLSTVAEFIQGAGGVIRNFGRAESASGIVLYDIGDNGLIINHGYVRAYGAFSDAVSIDGADGRLENYGQIHVESVHSGGMTIFGDAGVIENHGLIVTAFGTRSDAMQLAGLDAEGVGGRIENFGRCEVGGGNSAGIALTSSQASALNAGTIIGEGDSAWGFFSANDDASFTNTGRIITKGAVGVGASIGAVNAVAPALNGLVVNTGLIRTSGDGAVGIILNGDGSHVVNSGGVDTRGHSATGELEGQLSASGVIITGHGVRIDNSDTGRIITHAAEVIAVQLGVREGVTADPSDTAALVNAGLIKAAHMAVQGGDGAETVVNTGRMVGDADLGGGADSYEAGAGGQLKGELHLGAGADAIVLDEAFGKLEVADFDASAGDLLDLRAFHFASADEALQHAHAAGHGVVFDLGAGDSLVLHDVTIAELTGGALVI